MRTLLACLLTWAALYGALIWRQYPSRTDVPEAIHFEPTPEQQGFYDTAFSEKQARYAAMARQAAAQFGVKDQIREFATEYHLDKAHVLEIGSGEGTLQDIVADYTGLDISATARKNYHKRFVQADARAMPFRDAEFDAAWSVWVLEHVPNPEQALREMRRVLKPGGLLFLKPAWLVPDYAADGYPVRPYSAFGFGGKLRKAMVPIQRSLMFEALCNLPIRAARLASWTFHGQPTAFHYRPLHANYDDYWMVDSDAVNSMDTFEAYLWFRSRGDQCLNCGSTAQMMRTRELPLIIRIKP